MLLPILYLHNMRYRTDPMTQNRKSSLEVKKSRFWPKKIVNNIFLISLKNFFGSAVFCKCFYPFYTCIICGIGPIWWVKLKKSGFKVKKSWFLIKNWGHVPTIFENPNLKNENFSRKCVGFMWNTYRNTTIKHENRTMQVNPSGNMSIYENWPNLT